MGSYNSLQIQTQLEASTLNLSQNDEGLTSLNPSSINEQV